MEIIETKIKDLLIIKAVFKETLSIIALEEITAFIQKHVGFDNEQVFYLGFYDFHGNYR